MPTIATPRTIDPLGAFIAGAFTVEARRPIPLVSTRFDVEIDGGLATVVTKQLIVSQTRGSDLIAGRIKLFDEIH